MSVKWLYIFVPATLLAMVWGYTIAGEDSASATQSGEEEEKKEAAPEFPPSFGLIRKRCRNRFERVCCSASTNTKGWRNC